MNTGADIDVISAELDSENEEDDENDVIEAIEEDSGSLDDSIYLLVYTAEDCIDAIDEFT